MQTPLNPRVVFSDMQIKHKTAGNLRALAHLSSLAINIIEFPSEETLPFTHTKTFPTMDTIRFLCKRSGEGKRTEMLQLYAAAI